MLIKRRRPVWLRVLREIYFSIERPINRFYFWLFRPKTLGVKSLIFKGNKLLLVRLGYSHKKWVFPGGKVDKRESLIEAAKRELFEESGVATETLQQFGSLYSESQYKKNTVYYFLR